MIEQTRTMAHRARTVVGVTAQNLAVQDVIALAFHSYMFLRVSIAPDSPDAMVARRAALALLTVTACAFVLSRGEVIRSAKRRALTYRLGLFVPMVFSYFEMRPLLPALQPELVDHTLYAIDQWLIGTTPALWLSRFNVEPVVEWVAFFYYLYFYILILMLIPALFLERGRRLQVMAGAIVVCAGGHFLYTLVPGAGPYATIGFDQPLQGGFWWRQVEFTVATAGARLDIFPSLHTAYPIYLMLHAFGHRDSKLFRWLWPVLAFVAVNIMIATMFLRWHWMIDVMAGLLLAATARRFAVVVAERESLRGTQRDDRQPVWEPL